VGDRQDGTRGDPSQCAIRETREETGVLVEPTGILGVYSDPGHIVAYTDGEIRQE
jgi:ADP-ribose pyrophosphatase YjhB (NUDIX family)